MVVNNNQCDYAVYAEQTEDEKPNNLDFDIIYGDYLYDDDLENAINNYRHLYDDQFCYTNPDNGYTYWFKITHLGAAVDENALDLSQSEDSPFIETCCPVEHVLTVYFYEFPYEGSTIAVALQNAEIRELGSCKYGYVYGYDDRGNKTSYYRRISNRVEVPAEGFGTADSDHGSDINFLYNLGQSIVTQVTNFEDIVNFNIGGQSFFSLLFSGGFLVYVTWCVTKWILPT